MLPKSQSLIFWRLFKTNLETFGFILIMSGFKSWKVWSSIIKRIILKNIFGWSIQWALEQHKFWTAGGHLHADFFNSEYYRTTPSAVGWFLRCRTADTNEPWVWKSDFKSYVDFRLCRGSVLTLCTVGITRQFLCSFSLWTHTKKGQGIISAPLEKGAGHGLESFPNHTIPKFELMHFVLLYYYDLYYCFTVDQPCWPSNAEACK